MRRIVATMALAGVLAGGWALPAGAQQDGIVIQNNGVDSSQSSAGADNVNVSLAPGNSSSTNGAGLNNDVGAVVKEKDRERKERKERNNTEELAAPIEEPATAPAEGDLQAYGEGEEWVEPAPEGVVSEQADDSNLPIQLPNTGAGIDPAGPLGAIASAIGALGLGAAAMRRRLFS